MMKDAKDLIPWEVTDISLRPFDGFWSFNPSIHFDGSLWRCVMRCCDYAMPNGVTIRSRRARPTGQQTKNAMVIFDPATWKPIRIYPMIEKDDLPRVPCPHVGYEDMRIFRTDKGGLQGIAASLHLRRGARPRDGTFHSPSVGAQNQPPEQVLVSFDDEYAIVAAKPIRGEKWSGTPQKNWVPFDDCVEPRFLYSIDKGTLFDDRGLVDGDDAAVRPSSRARPLGGSFAASSARLLSPTPPSAPSPPPAPAPPGARDDRRARSRSDLRTMIRGGDVQIVRGKRMSIDATSARPLARASSIDAMSSRPSSRPLSRPIGARSGDTSTRVTSVARALPPRYEGLRGGTQLVRIGADAWLGIGHEMKFVKGLKYYWHTWYTVDAAGAMTSVSEPMKLVPNGIEFAAGLVIDSDHVVVSFGVDDMECKIGETRLSAVMETLQRIER